MCKFMFAAVKVIQKNFHTVHLRLVATIYLGVIHVVIPQVTIVVMISLVICYSSVFNCILSSEGVGRNGSNIAMQMDA